MQHPSQQHPGGQLGSAVKGGEPVRRPARVNECSAQGSQHIGLALGDAGPAGQAQRAAQLLYAGVDIAGITQDDPGRLMSD